MSGQPEAATANAGAEDVGWASLLGESVSTVVQPSRWGPSLRHPIQGLRRAVGDGPLNALVILFGLNAVDELDRTGFGILIPNIRDDLHMSNAGILSVVALSLLVAFLLQLPIAVAADRYPRVPIVIAGALCWGVFSLFTGLAVGAVMLVIARSGAGIGRATVDPTHNSLLADYYAVDRRSSVFSIHRGANVLGQFAGPLLAGGLALGLRTGGDSRLLSEAVFQREGEVDAGAQPGAGAIAHQSGQVHNRQPLGSRAQVPLVGEALLVEG